MRLLLDSGADVEDTDCVRVVMYTNVNDVVYCHARSTLVVCV